jgi:CelD/BcsL family acetyltransferase involved in cellulose biosynthesis
MEAFPNAVNWVWSSPGNDLPEICERIESVACTTYQRGLGVGFINNAETRDRLALFAKRNQFRVCLVEVNGQPTAFWLGTIYRGVFHSGALGYKPEVEDYGVGTVLFFRTVEELAREGVGCVDFGQGDADYKERFGDRSWKEADVHLFGQTSRGRLFQMYVGGADVLDRVARATVRRLGVFARIKQSWRARLRKRQSAESATTD